MARQRLVFMLTTLLFLFGASFLRAEELSVDDEAAVMAQEDEEEAALPINKKPPGAYSGRVQLTAEPSEDGVVGFFVAKERAYQLRVAQPDLLPKLQRYNGKTVALEGKIRMRGKYFVAEGIQLPAPGVPRTDRDKRSGM